MATQNSIDNQFSGYYNASDMNGTTRYLFLANAVWLGCICFFTFPLMGILCAAPVILVCIRCRKSTNARLHTALTCGNVSLLYMLYELWRFHAWKTAGNYDAQEGLFYLFLIVKQCGISTVAMLLPIGLMTAYRNLKS